MCSLIVEKDKRFYCLACTKSKKIFFFLNNYIIFLHCIADKSKVPVDTDDTDEEGAPQISLQEMLDDLHLGDDATGDDGAAMMDD